MDIDEFESIQLLLKETRSLRKKNVKENISKEKDKFESHDSEPSTDSIERRDFRRVEFHDEEGADCDSGEAPGLDRGKRIERRSLSTTAIDSSLNAWSPGLLGRCEALAEQLYGKAAALSFEEDRAGIRATVWSQEGLVLLECLPVRTRTEAIRSLRVALLEESKSQ